MSSSDHCDQELARRQGVEGGGGEFAESYLKIKQPSPGRWGIRTVKPKSTLGNCDVCFKPPRIWFSATRLGLLVPAATAGP